MKLFIPALCALTLALAPLTSTPAHCETRKPNRIALKTVAFTPVKSTVAKKASQKVVVHLSNSESPNSLHAAFMAMGLATGLEKMGANVTLMLDASAPNFAKKAWSGKALSSGTMAGSSKARTLGDVFSEFVQAGGKIVLCPHCSKMCGVQDGNVVPGAKIGAEGELVKLIYGADKVLDY